MINQEDIMNIRKQIDIVDVISSYIPLNSKGKNFFGVCPFHDDNNPSMSVSKEKQIYTCFSCGATGNVFKFIMDYENISFVEAVKMCADKVSYELNVKGIVTKQENNKELFEIYNISNKLYQNNLFTALGTDARTYLENRGIGNEIIKNFGIGLSLKDRTILTKVLNKKEFKNNFIDESGLLLKTSIGYQDMFLNRIMFPLFDLTGNVVGFSGRIYNNEDESKYINTKETKIFKKGELLYNYHLAKSSARIKNQVIIVEGFLDVIRTYTIDIKNVVASMGTAFTSKQANILRKMAKDIILCFDGDKAGQKASASAIVELEKLGISPKVVVIPESLDPDEYILKYGKDSFYSLINNPLTALDFKLKYYKGNVDLKDSKEMATYVNKMIEEISKIEDDVEKEIALNKISVDMDLDKEFIKTKITKKPVEVIKKVKIKYNKYEQAEQCLLYYMLKDIDVIKMYNKKITRMSKQEHIDLGKEINLFYKKYGYINVADLLIFSNDDSLSNTINIIESLNLEDEYEIKAIDDYLKTIREYNVTSEVNKLKVKIKNASNKEEKLEYMNIMMDILKGEEVND
ncbi:MAG: DNA primase [Mycoplasmatota bacterium]